MDIGDLEQQIQALRAQVQSGARQPTGIEQRIAELEDQVAELRLYLAVLLRLATSKGLVTTDQLQRIVEAIDAADGTQDGKYTGKKLT